MYWKVYIFFKVMMESFSASDFVYSVIKHNFFKSEIYAKVYHVKREIITCDCIVGLVEHSAGE